jgi:LuxR family transcriptional regulator, positive regulator of biofilm formation
MEKLPFFMPRAGNSRSGAMNEVTSRKVFVAGANNLQNELIASTLSKETGLPCISVEDLSRIKTFLAKDEKSPCLALYDCLGKDRRTFLSDLKQNGAERDLMVGLFNLKKSEGLEKEAFACGARGFFYRGEPFSLLVKGIAAIFDGEFWISRQLLSEWADQSLLSSEENLHRPLLEQEKRILSLMTSGAPNKEIAEALCMSPHTVKKHIHKIFKKIDVHNKTEAVLWAGRHLDA